MTLSTKDPHPHKIVPECPLPCLRGFVWPGALTAIGYEIRDNAHPHGAVAKLAKWSSAPAAASDVTAADDLQDIAAGASLAIALYSHTARQIAVYVLYKMWMNLDRAFRPGLSNLRSLKDEEYLSSNPN